MKDELLWGGKSTAIHTSSKQSDQEYTCWESICFCHFISFFSPPTSEPCSCFCWWQRIYVKFMLLQFGIEHKGDEHISLLLITILTHSHKLYTHLQYRGTLINIWLFILWRKLQFLMSPWPLIPFPPTPTVPCLIPDASNGASGSPSNTSNTAQAHFMTLFCPFALISLENFCPQYDSPYHCLCNCWFGKAEVGRNFLLIELPGVYSTLGYNRPSYIQLASMQVL